MPITVLMGKNTGCTKVDLSASKLPSPAGSVSSSGGFFFYSNSPEAVTSSALADNGYFLNKYTATGSGQVYSWHRNTSGNTLTAGLRIYNPNSFAIKVSSSNYGLTKNVYNDVAAWWNFWGGNSTSVVINANSWGNIFMQSSIPVGSSTVAGTWGYVARLSITNNATGTNASADLYDIAYKTSPAASLTTWAAKDPGSTTKRRGYATSGYYWCTVTANTINMTSSSTPQVISFGASSSSMSNLCGVEVPTIDPSGQAGGRLEGNYGVQHHFTIPVKNTTSSAMKIRLFAGNQGAGGSCTAQIAFNGFGGQTGGCSNLWASIGQSADLIEDTIPAGQTATYTLQLVIPAGTCAPYALGVRKV